MVALPTVPLLTLSLTCHVFQLKTFNTSFFNTFNIKYSVYKAEYFTDSDSDTDTNPYRYKVTFMSHFLLYKYIVKASKY